MLVFIYGHIALEYWAASFVHKYDMSLPQLHRSELRYLASRPRAWKCLEVTLFDIRQIGNALK